MCPSGQFLIGFDAAGQLVCGFPLIVAQATMAFYEGFDLETGTVLAGFPFPLPPEADFHFAFNSEQPNPIVLFQKFPAEIAFLDATPFDTVAPSIVSTLTFTTSLIGVPFDFDDTVVIRTATGHVFKVGKPVNNGDNTVTFSYAPLQ